MLDMSLKTRLATGFGVIIMLLILVGGVALHEMQVLATLHTKTYRHPFTVSNAVRAIEIDIERIHATLQAAALDGSAEAVGAARSRITAFEERIEEEFSTIRERFLGGSEMLDDAEALLTQWPAIRTEILDAIRRDTAEGVPDTLWAREEQHVRQLEGAMGRLSTFAFGKAAEFQEGNARTVEVAFNVMYATLALSMLAALAFTLRVTRSVVRPVREIAEVSEAIADGDLSRRIAHHSKDEIGLMADSLRRMLTGVVGEGQSILNSMPVHFWTAGKDLTVGFINRRAYEAVADACGCEPDGVSGRLKVGEAMRDDEGRTRALAQRSLESRTRVEGQVRYTLRDRRMYLQLVVSPLYDAQGEVTGVMGIGLDVTARVKAETKLRQARDAAEAANISKSSFLANMSHEIRTPLNGVQGMLQLLGSSPLDDEQREYMEAALTSGRNLLSVIDDILDISKLEAGRLDIVPAPFSLASIVSTLRSTFTFQVREKGLHLTFDVSPDIPPLLVGDEGRIRQVLFNLVGNAVRFTETGGVHVGILPREAHEDSILLDFFVTDTGIGIPQEKQRTVFEEFTQVDSSASRKYQGTGLGLSIAHRLVGLMNGEITLDSAPGRGTTVRVQLPLGVAPAEAVEAPRDDAPAPPSQHSMRVLLAEDDRINQLAVSRMLEKAGHDIRVAETGKQVLDALDQDTFDCVLMDIQMPEMDGLEATRRIREKYGDDPPIIALTAHAMKGDRETCIEAGANDYVSKPVDADALFQALDKLRRTGTGLPPSDGA